MPSLAVYTVVVVVVPLAQCHALGSGSSFESRNGELTKIIKI